MGTHRRWSKETKLAILEEAERNNNFEVADCEAVT